MKINMNQVNYIIGTERPHINERMCFLANFELRKVDNYNYAIIGKAKFIVFVLLFIPCAILDLFDCAWNNGLKHYNLPNPIVYNNSCNINFEIGKRAEKVYQASTN